MISTTAIWQRIRMAVALTGIWALNVICGCAAPQAQFVQAPVDALGLAPVSTSPSSPGGSSNASVADLGVVRSQNPNAQYTAGGDTYLRGPMTPSAPNQNSQWGQFQPSPAPSNTWNGNYPAPSAAPSWNTPTASGPAAAAAAWNGVSTPTASTAQWNSPAPQPAAPAWNNTANAAVNSPAYLPAQNIQAQFTTPVPPAGTQPVFPGGPVQGLGGPVQGLNAPVLGPPATGLPAPGGMGVPSPLTDIIVNVAEAQTGRLLIGAAVNSDAGVTGQIVLDEKNFDWRRVPTSWSDLPNAFRGDGQGLRIEALPGSQVQRYMVQFTEPYLFDTRVSFNASAFLFDRQFFDWDESRVGGRFGFGYRVTPDLSVQLGFRGEEVEISDARVPGVPELDAALGENELYGIRFSITQDTRDIPFAPTQGYYMDLSFEQVMGTFDYSRAALDLRRYYLVTERPDGSGRHVLGFSNRISISGSQTPIYENYFAGGYSTLRGFDFRGATPLVNTVAVGGELSMLGSVEYRLPVTADDSLQAVFFCDYGTIEEDIDIDYDDYRVSLGAGLRISVPALSAAPIALDFAVPIAREDTDDIQNFAFFVGVSR